MTILPISVALVQVDGAKLEAIEGVITRISDKRTAGENSHGQWSFQKGEFRGSDGGIISIKFDGWDPIGQEWVGHNVRFVGLSDPKAKTITVDTYNGKKEVVVKGNATVAWNPPDYGQQATPSHNGPPQGPPRQQQGPPPAQHQQGPPPHQQRTGPPSAGSQPQQRQGPIPIHGATVGMGIKIAVDILQAAAAGAPDPGTPEWTAELYRLASDVVRVALRMEEGKLAPGPAERQKRAAERKMERPPTEPDYSQQPPPNSAQSHQPPPGRQDAPPMHPPMHPPMNDDDVPF